MAIFNETFNVYRKERLSFKYHVVIGAIQKRRYRVKEGFRLPQVNKKKSDKGRGGVRKQ